MMGCICGCHDKLDAIGVRGCCFECQAEHDTLRNALRLNGEMQEEKKELLSALARDHNSDRCPYNSYGKCWACVALKKFKEQIPDQHLAVCSVCKELIEDTFAARKAAWCENCGGYSHPNCWPAHNLTYCLKRVVSPQKFEHPDGCGCECCVDA